MERNAWRFSLCGVLDKLCNLVPLRRLLLEVDVSELNHYDTRLKPRQIINKNSAVSLTVSFPTEKRVLCLKLYKIFFPIKSRWIIVLTPLHVLCSFHWLDFIIRLCAFSSHFHFARKLHFDFSWLFLCDLRGVLTSQNQ